MVVDDESFVGYKSHDVDVWMLHELGNCKRVQSMLLALPVALVNHISSVVRITWRTSIVCGRALMEYDASSQPRVDISLLDSGAHSAVPRLPWMCVGCTRSSGVVWCGMLRCGVVILVQGVVVT